MRKKREKLIFGGVRAQQFVAQGHIARFLLHEIEHALNVLARIEQAQKVDIAKTCCARAIAERFFDQLIGPTGREHILDYCWRYDLDLVVGRGSNVGSRWKLANLQRHLRKGVVYMQKAACFRVN